MKNYFKDWFFGQKHVKVERVDPWPAAPDPYLEKVSVAYNSDGSHPLISIPPVVRLEIQVIIDDIKKNGDKWEFQSYVPHYDYNKGLSHERVFRNLGDSLLEFFISSCSYRFIINTCNLPITLNRTEISILNDSFSSLYSKNQAIQEEARTEALKQNYTRAIRALKQ